MAAPRSVWKGFVKVSLVQIPARIYSASEAKSKVSFNRLHKTCHGPTGNVIHCDACKMDLTTDDCEKGYAYGKQYITFSDTELDAIKSTASNVLELMTVTTDVLPPIYIDSVMFLVPEPGAQQAFETVKQALKGRTAVGTLVLHGRTVRVALVPQADSQVFTVYKLRAASQVRNLAAIDHGSMTIIPPVNDVALATQLLDSIDGHFPFGEIEDDYAAKVQALLESKINGTAPVVVPAPVAPKVSSLQEALAESLKLAAAKVAAKPAAVAALPTKAAKPLKAALPAKGKKAKAS